MASNRKMMKMLLMKAGVNVEMAEDGSEAVKYVFADLNRFNIVFMDNLMPTMVSFLLYNFHYFGLILFAGVFLERR